LKVYNNRIILDDAERISPEYNAVAYTDITGIRFLVPLKLILRLYGVAKADANVKGLDWEEYCDSQFKI